MPDEKTQTSRNVFLKMLSREEQLGTLYDLVTSSKNEQAKDIRQHDKMREDINFLRGELSGIGMRGQGNPSLTTYQKINEALTSRSATWVWYRDRVLAPTLAAVHTLIIMAILYLAFGGKLP